MKSKEHSRQVRNKVVEKFKAGLGYKKISQALNISRNTVQSIIRKWKEYGTTVNLPRQGRPPKLTGRTRRALIRDAAKRPTVTLDEMQRSTAQTSHSNMKCEEEEGLDDQQVCNQERNSSLDQEDPELLQIKEEPEELCISQEVEQIVVKQEDEGFVWAEEERLRLLDNIWKPEMNSHGTDFQHECEEQLVLADRQGCNQERSVSPDQEDPELPQIKEEPEEPCTSQDVDGLILKQETEGIIIFMVAPTYEESEPDLDSDQLLPYSSPEPESRDQEDNFPVLESRCKTDTSKKSVKCDICGKTFEYRSKLTRHMRVHTGEKPHSCSTCGKRFSLMINLKTHMRIHTGEKPYSCGICGKEFRDQSTFKKHMTVHTGEKPYSCSTCGKSFSQKPTLERHQRSHTGEKLHSCGTCGKEFSQMINLKTHMRIHTGEKPHSCSTCGKSFIQRIQLQRHMRVHTG